MFQAMKNYSGRLAPSFELWCYIASSQPGRVFVLSPKAIEAEIGMKEDAYRKAVNNLIDDGYLVLKNDETNTRFDFYEVPRKKKEGESFDIEVKWDGRIYNSNAFFFELMTDIEKS